MSGSKPNLKSWIERHRHAAVVPYAGAALAVWVGLSFWTFTPALHRHLFLLLLAAVLFTARFLGFGPALFCSVVSAACLDFFALPPYFRFGMSGAADVEKLVAFLAISVFAGSMARQKTLVESRADRSTREMAAIVEYSCDAIYGSRPDGIITSWNRAAELLYGYSAEEAVGSSIRRLGPPERVEELEANRQIVNSGGDVSPYRTERMRKDGTRCPVLLSVSSLRNRRGEIVGASTIARDISAEKQSEEAIRRSEKLATTGRLAASIAHEINNPKSVGAQANHRLKRSDFLQEDGCRLQSMMKRTTAGLPLVVQRIDSGGARAGFRFRENFGRGPRFVAMQER